MTIDEAIAVFDKSADPNAQTEAWAVIRAELNALHALQARVEAAPVGRVPRAKVGDLLLMSVSHDMRGKRVRLLAVPANEVPSNER